MNYSCSDADKFKCIARRISNRNNQTIGQRNRTIIGRSFKCGAVLIPKIVTPRFLRHEIRTSWCEKLRIVRPRKDQRQNNRSRHHEATDHEECDADDEWFES